jgi:Spy/CpxP family protein refolding chaperone
MNGSIKGKLLAGFILVFLAGAMTGAFFGAVHARHVFVEFHRPDLVASRMKERLHSELKLTPEQETKIWPIVDKMAAQLEQIRTDTGRRVHQTFMDAHRDMSSNLTDEQRKKLQEIEERHRTFHVMHGGHGGSPGEMP